MSCRVLYFITFFAWAIALIQKTPFAFLSPGATQTAFGFAIGVTIASIITWFSRAGAATA